MKKVNTEMFIESAKKIHGDKYDYSKVEYKSAKEKVCIIYPKHGEFWQKPNKHLSGGGCTKCKESKLEREIRVLLEKHKIKYILDKTQPWLSKQRLDFFLPDYNIAIECQGIQHFEPFDFSHSNYEQAVKTFLKNKKSDLLKAKRCFDNGVKLLYYSDIKGNSNIITEQEEIINKIFETKK